MCVRLKKTERSSAHYFEINLGNQGFIYVRITAATSHICVANDRYLSLCLSLSMGFALIVPWLLAGY